LLFFNSSYRKCNNNSTAPCNPCTVSAPSDDATGVTSVDFNTINNTSAGTPAYTDYRNISTIVDLGQSYNLTVRVNTAGNYTVKTKAWIDWNNNCTFEVSEEYDLGSAVNVTDGQTSLSPKSITVPNDAYVGSVIMRIRAVYGTSVNPAACGAQSWSEAEDYTIIVNSSAFEAPSNLTAQLDNKNVILTLDSSYCTRLKWIQKIYKLISNSNNYCSLNNYLY
jgi:hypothetical protein